MVATPVGGGLGQAFEQVERRKPTGFQYVLENQDELSGAFLDGYNERETSPYYRGDYQFEAAYLYEALRRIASESELRGFFSRPCCSDLKLIWPFCDPSC
jgi:hypothetical protein